MRYFVYAFVNQEFFIKTITPTELRKNIYKLLDQVLDSGVPLEINRDGKYLKLISIEKKSKIQKLKPLRDLIVGNPSDLEDIDWTREWKP